jgi:hypothetical protein
VVFRLFIAAFSSFTVRPMRTSFPATARPSRPVPRHRRARASASRRASAFRRLLPFPPLSLACALLLLFALAQLAAAVGAVSVTATVETYSEEHYKEVKKTGPKLGTWQK